MPGKDLGPHCVKVCKQLEEDLYDLEREPHGCHPPRILPYGQQRPKTLLFLAACREPLGRAKDHAEKLILTYLFCVQLYCCWYGGSSTELICPSEAVSPEMLWVRKAGNSRASSAQTSRPMWGPMETSSSPQQPLNLRAAEYWDVPLAGDIGNKSRRIYHVLGGSWPL
jgi:hypothetical protein